MFGGRRRKRVNYKPPINKTVVQNAYSKDEMDRKKQNKMQKGGRHAQEKYKNL